MNPETSPENNSEKKMSALEKIKALKAEQEQKRIDEENQKTQEAENDSNLRQNSYEKQKAELDQINLRKQEIEESFERIKNERTNIISSGRQAKAEAKADEAVYESLKDKEVFNEVFAGEKEQWKKLQTEVSGLGLEKTEVDNAFSEKEKKVGELFNETDEGRRLMQEKLEAEAQTKREALAEEFLPSEQEMRHYFSLSRLQKGEWDSNTIKNSQKIVGLPKEEQIEVVSAVKEKLHGEISKAYKEKNKGNLELIKQDSDRVEEYQKNKTEISFMIRDFMREKMPEYQNKYQKLFENKNNEIYQEISRYYGAGGENLINILSSFDYNHKERRDSLIKIDEKISSPEVSSSAANLQSVKDYLEGIEKANQGLIEIIESGDAKKIKEMFSSRSNDPSHINIYFGVDLYKIKDKLNDSVFLVKNPVSLALKLKPEELKGYYEQKISEQEQERENINNFIDSSVDSGLIQAEVMSQKTTISSIENDLNSSEKNKEKANKAIETIQFIRRGFEKKLYEKVYFTFPSTRINLSVPKFEEDFNKIESYSNKIQILEVSITDEGINLARLKNKKLGIFDSKSKHQDEIKTLEDKINNFSSEINQSYSSRNSLVDSKNELAGLFERLSEVKDFDPQKSANLKDGITLEYMLESLEDALEDITEQEFPKDKKELLEKHHEVQKMRETAKNQILANTKP